MSAFWQDLRYGMRMLAKAPGFTAVAALTLALGIGANTAIFSAVNGILLKPLPYANASRLVDVTALKQFPGGIQGTMYLSRDKWNQLRTQSSAIADMAFWDRRQCTLTGDAAPELISGAEVSSEFFPLMGARPLIGRPILPGDTQPGAKPIAVISYGLWRTRWGGSDEVLKETMTLDDKFYAIVGVMPPGFDYPISTVQSDKGVWVPLIISPGKTDERDGYPVVLLKKGVSLAAANAQFTAVSPRILTGAIEKQFGGLWSGMHFVARPLEKHFNDLDKALVIVLGAVGFVLLIACVNVSGLLLARGWGRRREVAIREALGASRTRIVRQFLTESVLLALAGGVLGLLFSVWGVHVLRAVTPTNLPEHGHFDLNANILWFTLAVSLLTGILFGLAPALQASTHRVGAVIRAGFGASLAGTSAKRPRRLRSALVVFEIALAVILVIGATLVARSFEKLTATKLGFRTDHIITMDANFTKSVCDTTDDKKLAACKAAIFDVLGKMQKISDVREAAVSSEVPLARWSIVSDLKIEGQEGSISLNSGILIAQRSVSSDYFRTFAIPLLTGREFTEADTSGSQRVAIVDQAFAKKYFGGNALGRRLSMEEDEKGNPQWMDIVGIVESARDTALPMERLGEIYLPYAQAHGFKDANFIARTSADPAVMLPALRRAIWAEDKEAPITDVETMDQVVADSVAEPRFQSILLGSFGALGLLLAVVGIYGVISYGVTQRTREIGMRMALGARPQDVLRMVIGEGMLLAGAGILLGAGGALALTRFLRSLLFEIKPTDPATFVGVAVVLAVVALAACWIPARRAMKVEPMEALRYE